MEKLKQLNSVVAIVNAVHNIGNVHESAKASSDIAGGLYKVLALAVGARVMLKTNLWVERGLVNGSTGTVKAIIFHEGERPPQLPRMVLVHFEKYTGPTLEGGVVPITPFSFHWFDKHHVQCCREQIPLVLCWAMTIHKSQGLTLDKAVVHLAKKDFCPGLTYVALTRVRHLHDLLLSNLCYGVLLKVKEPKGYKERLAEEARLRTLANANAPTSLTK